MPKKLFLLLLIASLSAGLNAGLSAWQPPSHTYVEIVSEDESTDEDPEAGGPPLTEDQSGVYTDSVEYIDPYLCPTPEPCASDPEWCSESDIIIKEPGIKEPWLFEGVAAAPPAVPQEQSPLNVYLRAGNLQAPGATILLNYHNMHTWDVVEKGGKVKYFLRPKNDGWDPAVRVGGLTYALKEFHCHTEVEHNVRGNTMPSFFECHFVHLDCSKNKAAVAVFLVKPPDNNQPALAGVTPIQFVPGWYVPCFGGRYRYWGSLTTPAFDEGVAWTVPANEYKPVTAETSRLFRWKALGWRPLQQPNQRQIVLQLP